MDKLDQPAGRKRKREIEEEIEDLDSDYLDDEIDYGDDDDDYEQMQKEQEQKLLQEQQQLQQLQQQKQQQQKQHQQQRKVHNEDEDDDEVDDDEDDDDDDDDENNLDGDEGESGRRVGLDKQEDSEQGKESDKSTIERCKYWPACTAGESCTYYHPTKPCRNFPNCSFGDKCLYIHPPCKFNQSCARPNCPFAHPAVLTAAIKRGGRPPVAAAVQHFPRAATAPLHHSVAAGAPKCKYGFKCTNLMCKFAHQASEPCRYGANCLLETCPYTHPSDAPPRKKPASMFKWSAQS